SLTFRLYNLTFHDALPISSWRRAARSRSLRAARVRVALLVRDSNGARPRDRGRAVPAHDDARAAPDVRRDDELRRVRLGLGSARDRTSTRLNSSHVKISYA